MMLQHSRPRTAWYASAAFRRHRAAFLFLAPACCMVGLYVVYPIVSTIYLSFFTWDGMTEKTFVGLANYAELFQAPTFFTALKNNLLWLVLFLLAPPAGLAVALYLNQQVKGIRLIKSLFFAPFVLSGVVVGLIFSWFYDPTFGLLALLLGHGIPVLGDPRYVNYGIIFAALWPQTAYCMILFLTGLTAINADQVSQLQLQTYVQRQQEAAATLTNPTGRQRVRPVDRLSRSWQQRLQSRQYSVGALEKSIQTRIHDVSLVI